MSKEFLSRADLSGLPAAGRVVVGFSAGADSTALAHWLSRRIEKDRIVLAHLNHMLRGTESERDEAAARQFARDTGLRLVVSRVEIRTLAAREGMGLEECGRVQRYDLFHRLAPGENDRILTAHHAGDNAETLVLNLCRGAGLEGLCGIPRAAGKVLRPFLGVTREEIEDYCKANELSYMTDSSNFSTEFARNKVRLEILPLLRSLNPQVISAMTQTMELLSQDRAFLHSQGEALLEKARSPYGLDVRILQEAPKALRQRALRLWLEELGCQSPEKRHMDLVESCLRSGGALQLPGGLILRRHQGLLSAAVPRKEWEGAEIPVSLGETPLPDGRILVLKKPESSFPNSKQKIHNLYFKNALNCDIMTGNLKARTRRAGDRFSPAGRGCTKSLKQLFQECGMPEELRKTAVLLEWNCRLAWCQGVGPAEGFQAGADSAFALEVEVREH